MRKPCFRGLIQKNKGRERILLPLAYSVDYSGRLVVCVLTLLQLFPQHLSLLLELSCPCRTTFTFVVSSLAAGRFPALESLCHQRCLCLKQWAGRDSNSHDQRPPHFECGASTNFATRPWGQPYYHTLLAAALARLDKFENWPNDQSLWLVALELGE